MNTAPIEQLEIRDKYIADLRADNNHLRNVLQRIVDLGEPPLDTEMQWFILDEAQAALTTRDA